MRTARSPTISASVASNQSARGGVGRGDSSEQVWTSLRSWAPDVTAGDG